MNTGHEDLMRHAIALSQEGMDKNDDGPFGAILVKDGVVIAQGNNAVTSNNDPTMHAEIVAIRNACKELQTYDLTGCTLYTSCEPCPMCLGAIYWAHIDAVYYAATQEDAAKIGFDDHFIYHELSLPKEERQLVMHQLMQSAAVDVFCAWEEKEDKITY